MAKLRKRRYRPSIKSYKVDLRTPQVKSKKLLKGRYFFFSLFLLILIFYLFLFSSYFKIRDISLKGTSRVHSQEIWETLKPILNSSYFASNMIFFKTSAAEDLLKEKIHSLKEVKINKKLPSTLEIVIEERKPALIWEVEEKSYLVSEEGVVFAEAEGSYNYPKIIDKSGVNVSLGFRIVTDSFIDFIVNLIAKLPQKTKYKVEKIIVEETTFDVEVKTIPGLSLYMDTTRSVDSQIINFQKALQDAAKNRYTIYRYVDLRLENKIFYK